MLKIQYVKAIFEKNSPVENFLVSVKKEFIFKGEHFEDCETIEEMRDKIYVESIEENISYFHLYTFKSKKDLEKGKQYEYIGE